MTKGDIVRVHRRQFVVGPRPHIPTPDWLFLELSPGLVLSADPDLRIDSATDRNGIRWWLLGAAVDTDAERDTPLAEIGRRNTDAIEALYQGWSGRWVLIGRGELHADATAMLACYHGTSPDGETWASSSPVLIRRILGLPEQADNPQTSDGAGWRPSANATATGAVKGISWFPPPHSGTAGVRRLLPSQILDLRRATLRPRPLASSIDDALDDDDLLEALAQAIGVAVEKVANLEASDEATLLLSGGRDSRLLLSLARSRGLNLRTYTRVHWRASLADRLLPPKLAGMAGYPHRAVCQKGEIPGRRQVILDHAGYAVSWLSAEEFMDGGSDPLKGVAIAGLSAALGRDRFLSDAHPQDLKGAWIAKRFDENASDLIEAFDAWLAWRRAHPDPVADMSDCFFLEQRTGGRKGAKEQICDLLRFERVPPLNSTYIFGLVLKLSPELQRKGDWMTLLIKASMPELLREPINPPDSHFGKISGRLASFLAYGRVRRRHLSTG
ncbi:MAG: hypothetical protein ACFB6S_17850 [Geminicoccaceae bacterium]